MKVLITGFAGFIGSNLTRYWLEKYPDDQIIGLDAMTYAAHPEWVYQSFHKNPEYRDRLVTVVANLENRERTSFHIRAIKPDMVLHLAAESHVCRSIETPGKFVASNIVGTYNLLEACIKLWGKSDNRFHHVSTDEVYGDLPIDQPQVKFSEKTPYAPRSPYAASKAASDHLVQSCAHTFGLNATISNCSNNYGPNQDLEKLVPKTISRILKGEPVEIYGTGAQIRDWLWVGDHCSAIDLVAHKGKKGETYCVGGGNELTNLNLVMAVARAVEEVTGRPASETILEFTDKRPTDDKRYAIDYSKINYELGWRPISAERSANDFHTKLKQTVQWYIDQPKAETIL